jgi:histidinol phosphatase-like PHP family hydrolase
MWLACDTRVTILGHPWWHSKAIWYEDFSVIPASMHAELAAALKENKKHVECNPHVLCAEKASERFRCQYAEYLRMLFEFGIPITYGSDSHHDYKDLRPKAEAYLAKAGFRDGDFSELDEADLW